MQTNTPQQPASLTVDQALQHAIAHHQAGQLQDAERLYRAILQSQPNHPDANHNLGMLAVQVKQPAAGLPYFKAALEANPNQGQYWLSYIDALILAGQNDAAKLVLEQGQRLGLNGEAVEALARRLEELSGSEPSSEEINTLVAQFTEGLYTEATIHAQAMTKHYPLHGFGWMILGAVLKQMGRSADALAPMQKAVALLPDAADAHSNLGVILNDLARLGEAEVSCRRALEIKPDYAEAHSNLGNTLRDSGRLDEAEVSYRRALEFKPDYADAHSNLGATLHDLGRLNEAKMSYRRALVIKPDYLEAHSNLGNTLRSLGRLSEAEVSCRRALEIKPGYAEAHSNLGNILRDLGRLSEAEFCYRCALEIKPDYAEAHGNLGVTLHDLGRLDEAEVSYRRALKIKPDYADAHSNLGATLHDLGRLDEAEVSYRRALKIKQDYADGHYNLGNILQGVGRLNEAEDCYRQALEIKPDYVGALNNLALLFNTQGKSMMAMNIVKQSLHIKETQEAKSNFVTCAKCMRWTQDDSEVRANVIRALSEPWGRPNELVQIGTDFVKLSPVINECVARAADAWPLRLSAQDLFGADGFATVADDLLLLALLDSAPICEIEMERFLTMARRIMLEAATGMTASESEIGTASIFYCALARQCFINEYAFSYTDDEIKKVNVLRDSLATALEAGTQPPPLWLVAVAAYFRLCSFPFATRLLDRQWPEEVAAVLAQQIREPAEEQRLRATIPQLTPIEDEVSLLVQDQYEENPYPRWVKVAPAMRAKNIVEYLCQKFPQTSFNRHGKSGSIDVLIAGCGTGQHSIETAQYFHGAQVLAVDLSLSSLSYAKRKTRELGITSIEYAQADILKLKSLGRSFDVIESSGVLHHLADPWAGWQVLLSLLRPGGFMKLGFYSKVARRNIVRMRTFIAEQGYGATANEIRRCRQELIDLDTNADFGITLKSPDFFSISACRDLLFHVQEHRMSLTGIDAFLQDNNLAFLGFDINAGVLHAYKQRFHDDHAATNLGQWQIFENENPDTFLSMYQFWIQKAV